jgi:hypothetical protein
VGRATYSESELAATPAPEKEDDDGQAGYRFVAAEKYHDRDHETIILRLQSSKIESV